MEAQCEQNGGTKKLRPPLSYLNIIYLAVNSTEFNFFYSDYIMAFQTVSCMPYEQQRPTSI